MGDVIHVISDTNIGGAGIWLLNFVRSTRLRVTVVLPKNSLLKEKLSKAGAEVEELAGLRDQSLDLRSLLQLWAFLKKRREPIVHTHAALTARIAARLSGKKIVFTRHWIGDTSPGGTKRKLNALLCDRAVAPSTAVYEGLLQTGIPKEKIVLIPNGVIPVDVGSGQERSTLRARYGIGKAELAVGIVARLETEKGHKYFLEAAAKCLQERDDLRFIIAGTGALAEALKRQAGAIRDHVTFTGFVDDIAGLYQALDISVCASMEEAFGLSVAEAMSAGLPVVVTDCGGCLDLAKNEETGIVVPKASGDALAGGILRLAKDQALRKTLGQNARRMILAHFTAAQAAEKLEALYATLG